MYLSTISTKTSYFYNMEDAIDYSFRIRLC